MSDNPRKSKPKIERRRSDIHGHGVFATGEIADGEPIVEYRGRLLTHDEANRTYGGSTDTGHTFLFTLNEHYVIDANHDGNVARWINHSCEPNATAFRIPADDGDPRRDRVVIEALRAIRTGEEITYCYGIRLEERHSRRLKQIWACRCGSNECTGTMLKPKQEGRRRPG